MSVDLCVPWFIASNYYIREESAEFLPFDKMRGGSLCFGVMSAKQLLLNVISRPLL